MTPTVALPVLALLFAVIVTALVIGLVLRAGASFFDVVAEPTHHTDCSVKGHHPQLVVRSGPQPTGSDRPALAPAADAIASMAPSSEDMMERVVACSRCGRHIGD